MPKTTTLSKCAMQSFSGQFHQLKNFSVENRTFSQMLPRRFSISALVRPKSKLRGGLSLDIGVRIMTLKFREQTRRQHEKED